LTYRTFDDLPNHIKSRILRLEQPEVQEWVLAKIPALGGRSIIEVMNEERGEAVVRDYLARTEGMFS
jgi:uncharacterized protein (DUF2384 family)